MADKLKILLIEDEDSIREIYKTELDFAGFQIDDFAEGKKGLAAFKNNDYDLVVLDIILNDVNGLDLLQEMKKDEQKRDIPILLLTTLTQDIIVKRGIGLGARAYLHKDQITPDKLVDKIKELLPAS